eukprot:13006521-Alexandrium_andersonii.AAC.1
MCIRDRTSTERPRDAACSPARRQPCAPPRRQPQQSHSQQPRASGASCRTPGSRWFQYARPLGTAWVAVAALARRR